MRSYRLPKLRHLLILVFCIPATFIFIIARRQQWLESLTGAAPKCIGWRATSSCIPLGPRNTREDRTCSQDVRGGSGYCLCEGNITVARMSCGAHRFRCRDKCAELAHDTSAALPLPRALVCGTGDAYDMKRLVPAWAALAVGAGAAPRGADGTPTGGRTAAAEAGLADADATSAATTAEDAVQGGSLAGAAEETAAGSRSAGAGEAGGSETAAEERGGRDSGERRSLSAASGGAARRLAKVSDMEGAGANTAAAVGGSDGLASSARARGHAQATGSGTASAVPAAAVIEGRAPRDSAALARASNRVWDIVDELVGRHAPTGVKLPGPRTLVADWVMEGRHLKASEVSKLAATVAELIRDLPPYPGDETAAGDASGAVAAGTRGTARGSGSGSGAASKAVPEPPLFSGRGVVMVGGGMVYLIPAWVSLHVLRRAGCTLPVELWFPVEEFPTPPVEAALAGLGVTSRRLAARDLAQRGYGVKVAALLLSSFREVLFLDSDNAVLRDPTFLFDSLPYQATGALLWPDYWDRTAAREVPRILNISAERMPAGTFESGQMVIDKARHWRGLLVAAYMNVYGDVFSELLSCYVGKGDKETFAYGMLAAGEPMSVSPVTPGSAGLLGPVCGPRGRAGRCRELYQGNTMVQYGTDGLPLFFHANYHKWDLALPDVFEAAPGGDQGGGGGSGEAGGGGGWNRRWRVLQPGRRSVYDELFANATGGAGYDLERFVYDVLRAFRCAPWFEAYHAARVRMGEKPLTSLDGFHPVPDYITFREFYREGWSGSFYPLVHPPLTWKEHLGAATARGPGWWLAPLHRKVCRLARKFLPRKLRCKHFK